MKVLGTGINEENGVMYATFVYKKSEYIISWRPTEKEEGVVFDIGILPVKKGEKNGSYKRVNGKKNKDEAGIRKDEKGRA
jgi:hypothetical protein